MRARTVGVGLCVWVLSSAGCKKGEEAALPGEGFGCIGVVAGKDFGCTELESTATESERTKFGEACGGGTYSETP